MPVVRYQPAADDEGSSQGDPSVPPADEFAGGATFFTPAISTNAGPGTMTMSNGDPWESWGDSWSTGTSTSTVTYNVVPNSTYVNSPDLTTFRDLPVRAYVEPTEEELAQRQRDRERIEREYEERQLERRARIERVERERSERLARQELAKARALELLRLVLLPDELAHFDREGEVVVTGSDGRRYRVGDGVVSNIALLSNTPDGGYRGRLAVLCAHPNLNPGYDYRTGNYEREIDRDGLPHRDAHVAQILALRHNAPLVWRRANVDWYDTSETTRPLREWCSAHKFRGSDEDEDAGGVTDAMRAAFPAAPTPEPGTRTPEPGARLRDRLGRFAGREAA